MAPRNLAARKRIISPGDRMANDLFSDLFEGKSEPIPDLGPGDSNNAAILGNQFPVQYGTSIQEPAPGPWLPDQGEDRLYTVTMQASGIPAFKGTGPDNAVMQAMIYYGQGAGVQTKGPINLRNGSLQKFKLVCRSCRIVFYFVGSSHRVFTATVVASIAQANQTGADAYSWAFADPITGASGGVVNMGSVPVISGCVGQYKAIMQAAGGDPNYWLMLFDQTAFPPNGNPIPGGRGGQKLSAVGDWTDYGDEFAPGGLGFSTGLVVALSSTPDTYTAPTGTPKAVIDVKIGI